LFVLFVRSKTPKVVSYLVDFFLFGLFFFYSLFKLCISTFDSWKLFVFLSLGFASTFTFDLHEYEDLKDQLFKFVFLC